MAPNLRRTSQLYWNLIPSNEGRIKLPEGNGIGITPDLAAMKSKNIEVNIITK